MPKDLHTGFRVAHMRLFALAALVFAGGLGAADTAPASPRAEAVQSVVRHGVNARVARGTLRITGNAKANRITLRLKRGARQRIEVDTGGSKRAEFTFNRRGFKRIAIKGKKGDDKIRLDEGRGTFTGAERTAADGDGGTDRISFDGSDRGEQLEVLPASAGHLRLTRSGDKARLDVDDTEVVALNPRRGADDITVGDLTGTDASRVNPDLGRTPGGGQDGKPDELIFRGSGGDDNFALAGASGGLSVVGIVASTTRGSGAGDSVTIDAGAGNDRLVVNGSTGADNLSVAAAASRLLVLGAGALPVSAGGVEALSVDPGGGADSATLGNLAGTGVVAADMNLGTDGLADNATVSGTDGADNLVPAKTALTAAVAGLPYALSVVNGDGSGDRLVVSALNGADVVNASGTPAEGLALTLRGGGGADVVRGGAGDDTLLGDAGDDQVLGSGGADRMIWNPGDGIDLNEGGDGTDSSEVNGGEDDETFTVTANGPRVRFDRLNGTTFFLDIGTTENLITRMNGGTDQFSATGNLAALIKLTTDGGSGEDVILGSNGADILLGGTENDFLDGQQGADVGLLGAGVDTFQWDPGDGSDTVEGEAGIDILSFNGSAGAELFEASAIGTRLRFTRNLGNVVMDVNGTEIVDVKALGNTDTLTVNDLTGTGVTEVRANLAATLGGAAGDTLADNVIVNGTAGDDVIGLTGSATGATVTGLPAQVQITGADAAPTDRLTVNGLGGDDVINASAVAAGAIALTLDGGLNNDVLNGGAGDDTLLGGDGDDLLDGNAGTDTLDGGTGNNTLIQD